MHSVGTACVRAAGRGACARRGWEAIGSRALLCAAVRAHLLCDLEQLLRLLELHDQLAVLDEDLLHLGRVRVRLGLGLGLG